MYLHELEGFAVRLEDGTPVGLVSAVYDMPAGLMIEVQGPEARVPAALQEGIRADVDRGGRRLTIAPPEGLLES